MRCDGKSNGLNISTNRSIGFYLQVFLLLCAQQNVHLHNGESILHPYLLFSSAHLCTQQQKNWWQTAMELTREQSNEFLDHLATIRLDTDRLVQHPPKSVLLETARLLFKSVSKSSSSDDHRISLLSRLNDCMNEILNKQRYPMNNMPFNIFKWQKIKDLVIL